MAGERPRGGMRKSSVSSSRKDKEETSSNKNAPAEEKDTNLNKRKEKLRRQSHHKAKPEEEDEEDDDDDIKKLMRSMPDLRFSTPRKQIVPDLFVKRRPKANDQHGEMPDLSEMPDLRKMPDLTDAAYSDREEDESLVNRFPKSERKSSGSSARRLSSKKSSSKREISSPSSQEGKPAFKSSSGEKKDKQPLSPPWRRSSGSRLSSGDDEEDENHYPVEEEEEEEENGDKETRPRFNSQNKQKRQSSNNRISSQSRPAAPNNDQDASESDEGEEQPKQAQHLQQQPPLPPQPAPYHQQRPDYSDSYNDPSISAFTPQSTTSGNSSAGSSGSFKFPSLLTPSSATTSRSGSLNTPTSAISSRPGSSASTIGTFNLSNPNASYSSRSNSLYASHSTNTSHSLSIHSSSEFDVDAPREKSCSNSGKRTSVLLSKSKMLQKGGHDDNTDDDNSKDVKGLTEEQKAWKGIEEILQDDGDSIGSGSTKCLSEAVQKAMGLPQDVASLATGGKSGWQVDPKAFDVLSQENVKRNNSFRKELPRKKPTQSSSESLPKSNGSGGLKVLRDPDNRSKSLCGLLPATRQAFTAESMPDLMDLSSSSLHSTDTMSTLLTAKKSGLIVETDYEEGPMRNFLGNLTTAIERKQARGPAAVSMTSFSCSDGSQTNHSRSSNASSLFEVFKWSEKVEGAEVLQQQEEEEKKLAPGQKRGVLRKTSKIQDRAGFATLALSSNSTLGSTLNGSAMLGGKPLPGPAPPALLGPRGDASLPSLMSYGFDDNASMPSLSSYRTTGTAGTNGSEVGSSSVPDDESMPSLSSMQDEASEPSRVGDGEEESMDDESDMEDSAAASEEDDSAQSAGEDVDNINHSANDIEDIDDSAPENLEDIDESANDVEDIVDSSNYDEDVSYEEEEGEEYEEETEEEEEEEEEETEEEDVCVEPFDDDIGESCGENEDAAEAETETDEETLEFGSETTDEIDTDDDDDDETVEEEQEVLAEFAAVKLMVSTNLPKNVVPASHQRLGGKVLLGDSSQPQTSQKAAPPKKHKDATKSKQTQPKKKQTLRQPNRPATYQNPAAKQFVVKPKKKSKPKKKNAKENEEKIQQWQEQFQQEQLLQQQQVLWQQQQILQQQLLQQQMWMANTSGQGPNASGQQMMMNNSRSLQGMQPSMAMQQASANSDHSSEQTTPVFQYHQPEKKPKKSILKKSQSPDYDFSFLDNPGVPRVQEVDADAVLKPMNPSQMEDDGNNDRAPKPPSRGCMGKKKEKEKKAPPMSLAGRFRKSVKKIKNNLGGNKTKSALIDTGLNDKQFFPDLDDDDDEEFTMKGLLSG
jgi:hypothetical protein